MIISHDNFSESSILAGDNPAATSKMHWVDKNYLNELKFDQGTRKRKGGAVLSRQYLLPLLRHKKTPCVSRWQPDRPNSNMNIGHNLQG